MNPNVLSATVRRVRQGVLALSARRARVALPARYAVELPANVVARWNWLSPYDQHHLLAVAEELRRSGAPHTVVLAGVLHDVGKSGGVSLVSRTLVVLLKRFAPATVDPIRRSVQPRPGMKGIHLLLNHAEVGARTLEAEGVRQEVVWLVRHHESTSSHPYLRALQEADERN